MKQQHVMPFVGTVMILCGIYILIFVWMVTDMDIKELKEVIKNMPDHLEVYVKAPNFSEASVRIDRIQTGNIGGQGSIAEFVTEYE